MDRPTSTEGYTYFTIYRAHAVYINSKAKENAYAAGKADGPITLFADSFEEIRAKLDEARADEVGSRVVFHQRA